jgi:acylglycerol lipase
MEESTLETTGGLHIFLRTHRPERSPRGIVVIVHGFNSHGGYYTWVAQQLVATGIAVYVPDLRGRGKSDGERFYVDSFTHYVDDVSVTVTHAHSRDPALPIFLLGHSAGGIVACLYALDHQEKLAGLICESFAFQVPAPDFAIAVVKGVSHIAPHAHLLKLKNEDFSRNEHAVAAMNADPLIAHEAQASRTVAAMVRADERLEMELCRLTLPLLILHGTADKATKPSGSRRFFNDAQTRDKQLKLYEGHVHDLLNDDGREQVLDDIFRWIEGRLPWTT